MVTDDRATFESEDDECKLSLGLCQYILLQKYISLNSLCSGFARVGGPRVLAVDVTVR